VRANTARFTRTVKAQLSTSTRSPSPPPMLRPGTVELPDPPETTVPLAAVAHSMQIDARRKFAATYEDITQYMDKCEYLFEHDEFYDKSYKSLAKTVTELNKIGTDAQQQEREQLYNGLLDWLSTSSFSLEAPTYGAINEHQLIESGQTTRDLLVKMLLGLERLRALHITITDKARSAAETVSTQTDHAQNKRQLLKMVDESSFVWKTAAAEIVQLLHEERSKGGELVELYADKIRYLMGELEAQSNMITELRAQLEQQLPLPIRFHEPDLKTKQSKHEAASRQAKQIAGSQQQTVSDDVDEDDIRTSAAVSTLPDFNKQLITTLQKELEECRRQNASVVARGHEAAAKIRFLTEESNRKDKQMAQLQANIAKMRSETRQAEDDSQAEAEASRRDDLDQQQSRETRSKTGRRGRKTDSIQLQEMNDDDDDSVSSPMKLRQIIAAAKRQKRPSQPSHSAADLPSVSSRPQPASQSTAAAVVSASGTDVSRTERSTAHTKPDKPTRGQRAGGTRGKVIAAGRVTSRAAVPDKQEQTTHGVPQAPTFEQMGSFWQQSAVKEWAPVETSVDKAVAAKEVKTAARSAAQQTQLHNVDMNEAIEMTKLFLAGSKTTQQQQPTPAKAKRRESIQQQRKLVATSTHITPITPQLFTESTTTKAPAAIPTLHHQLQQPADTSSSRPAVTSSSSARPAETSELVSWQQHGARSPAEAAKLRAARLSAALFHSDEARDHKPVVQSAFSAALASKPTQQQQQQHKPQQNVATTKSKPAAKTAGYDLVGVNMQNLAQQAKLLENDSLSKTLRRFN